MKFYVLSKDGKKFGPADITALNQWIKEGRLSRDTELENAESGAKFRARDVQGLDFPASSPDLGGNDPILKSADPLAPTQAPHPSPGGQPTPYIAGSAQGSAPAPSQGQQPYQQAPQPGSPYTRHSYSTEDDGSQKMITTSWILTAVGFLLGCIILPPFAIYQANRAKRMGNENAQAPLVVAWIVMSLHILVYGIYLAIVVFALIAARNS